MDKTAVVLPGTCLEECFDLHNPLQFSDPFLDGFSSQTGSARQMNLKKKERKNRELAEKIQKEKKKKEIPESGQKWMETRPGRSLETSMKSQVIISVQGFFIDIL